MLTGKHSGYDAIVIGARCAGAPTAMLLARQGHKVLLVDRATFPSDIPHGHFIYRGGPRRLKAWGLLDNILASGCPPVSKMILDMGPFPLAGEDLVVDGVAMGCGPRRKVLDKILVDAAVAAGVELREQFSVEEFTNDGDRMTGIRGRDTRGGGKTLEHGRIIIGADGRNSQLARTVQSPVYEAAPTLLCYYFSYWSGAPCDALEVYVRNQRVILAFPTHDEMTAIFIGWPVEEFQQVRSDIEGNFMEVLARVPNLVERVKAGRREERFYGSADLPNFFRKPFGPGWALVGDAGHHKDPYLALGIADALRDAELLANAIHEGLGGIRPMDEALADYEKQRNELAMADYHENLARARFTPPPPEVLQLLAALQRNQDQQDISRFLMARSAMIAPEAFFNPENLGRILSKVGVQMATS
ncbi:MAG: NAD(P)/FAD-dependent oxidoreductase [Chloroflexota bacterium]